MDQFYDPLTMLFRKIRGVNLCWRALFDFEDCVPRSPEAALATRRDRHDAVCAITAPRPWPPPNAEDTAK